MKKLNYMFGAIAAVAMSLASCSPDDFQGVDENGLPVAADAKVAVDVDQTTNQATFTLDGKAVYPIWIMDWESSKPCSTQNGLRKIFSKAGDYVLKYRVGNRNGFSQGIGSVTFHIDNSLVDYGMYFTMLDGKKWRIAKEEQGHLGCSCRTPTITM